METFGSFTITLVLAIVLNFEFSLAINFFQEKMLTNHQSTAGFSLRLLTFEATTFRPNGVDAQTQQYGTGGNTSSDYSQQIAELNRFCEKGKRKNPLIQCK
jgi:hypothetical protein